MASLTELVSSTYEHLNHDPQLAKYKDSVVRRYNEHYVGIFDDEPWEFAQAEVDLTIKAKVTVETGDGITITADSAALGNTRRITGSGTTFVAADEGATLTDSSGNEYIIARVDSTTDIYLSTPWLLTAGVAYADFTITHNLITLPKDCNQVLSIVDRTNNRGALEFKSRPHEEDLFLNRANTGTPSLFLDDDPRRLPAPSVAPTVVAASGGSLPDATTYEYKYTFQSMGIESAASPVSAQVATATPNLLFNLSTIQASGWDDGSGALESGIHKILYRRDVTHNEPWYRIGTVTAIGSTNSLATTCIDSLPVPTAVEDLLSFERYIEPDYYRVLRVWTHPSADTTFRLRYLKRPPQLEGDQEIPLLPRKYHEMLKALVLRDIYDDLGSTTQAARWGKRADTRLEDLRNRYLSKHPERIQPGRWDRNLGLRHRNFGTASKV